MSKKKENLRTVLTRSGSKITLHHSKFELKGKVLSIKSSEMLNGTWTSYASPTIVVVRGKTRNVPFYLSGIESDGTSIFTPSPDNGYKVRVFVG